MENYLPLFIIILVAWVVPMILSGLEVSKVPSVIIEIIIGVIIGPFVLHLVSGKEPSLNFLSDIGFLLLIFLSGIALDIQKIISSFPSGKWRQVDLISNTFLIALLIYIGSVLLSIVVVNTTPFFSNVDKGFLIIILPSVALSIIVPVIKNDGEIARKFGQIILLVGAIATIMTILLIAIYAGVKRNNGFQFELLLFLIIFVVFFIAYKVGTLLIRFKLFQKLLYRLEHAASQIRVRGSLAILLLFVLIASAINTEPVLGAFFAGILLSIFLAKERSSLLFKLDGMSYGFFIPIFFIMVGVNLDMNSLKDFGTSFNFIILFLVSFYVIQVIPAAFMIKLFGFKRSLSAGILLTSRLGLSIATAQIGLGLGLITPATNAGIVIASILTCVISPMLYKFLSEKEDSHYSIYIVGGGQAGLALAKRLGMHSVPYLVIESQMAHWEILQSLNINAIYANDLDPNVYQKLKIRPVDTVVVLAQSDSKNINISKIIRTQLGHSKLITVTTKPELFKVHRELDDVLVVNALDALANSIENEIMRPSTTEALSGSFGAYRVEEIAIRSKAIDRKYVKDIPFPLLGSLLVVRRENEVFIPHGDTHLLLGDRVTVIGKDSALEEFRKLFE